MTTLADALGTMSLRLSFFRTLTSCCGRGLLGAGAVAAAAGLRLLLPPLLWAAGRGRCGFWLLASPTEWAH